MQVIFCTKNMSIVSDTTPLSCSPPACAFGTKCTVYFYFDNPAYNLIGKFKALPMELTGRSFMAYFLEDL